jgi:membrane-associated protein
MTEVTTFILGSISTYGLPLVMAIFLVNSLGLPLPSTLIVLTIGVFVHQGILPFTPTLLLSIVSLVLGDTIVFFVGRLSRSWIPSRIENSPQLQKVDAMFYKHGTTALYLSRWLINPMGPAISLIAGNSKYPFPTFLLIDVLGEITFVVLFGALGYIFSDQAALISDALSSLSGLILGLLILGIGAHVILQYRKRHRQY